MDKPTRPAEAPPAPEQSLAIILASPEHIPAAVDHLTEVCPTLSTMGATPEPHDTTGEICDALTSAIRRVSDIGFVPDTIYILCLPDSPVTSAEAVSATKSAGLTSTIVARKFATILEAVDYLTHPDGPNISAAEPTKPATPEPGFWGPGAPEPNVPEPNVPEPNADKQTLAVAAYVDKQTLAVAAYVDNTGQVWLKPL